MNFEIKTDNSKRKYTWSVRTKVALISKEFETQDFSRKMSGFTCFSRKGRYDLMVTKNTKS